MANNNQTSNILYNSKKKLKQNTLVLFDFDGTITNTTSFIHFVTYVFGAKTKNLTLFKSLPILSAYSLNLMPKDKVINIIIQKFFYNWSKEDLEDKAQSFTDSGYLETIIKPSAFKRLNEHKELGHTVFIVSASSESWMKFWCQKHDVSLISSKLLFDNENIFKGGFDTKYCYGEEKVNQIMKTINLEHYEDIIAYGDSRGDMDMLKLASMPFYDFFT